jgi:hypothetical protein
MSTVDTSRFLPIFHLKDATKSLPSTQDLISLANELTEQCCKSSSRRKGSLYAGGLGPHVYLRLQWALQEENSLEQRQRYFMLAKNAAEYCLEHNSSSSSFRVSLLESPWVGAKCLLAVVEHRQSRNNATNTSKRDSICAEIIETLTRACHQLPGQECEVLHGRAGAMQAILWLRKELQDPLIGREFCLAMANHILQVGIEN